MEEPLLNELPRVPDFRSLGKHQEGFATEIGSSDADRIKQAIEAAQTKPVESVEAKTRPIVHTVAGYTLSKPLPDTSRIGWTSFSSLPNPGGTLKVVATEKRDKEQKELWSDDVVIYVVGIGFYIMVQLGASGIIAFMLGLLFLGKKIYTCMMSAPYSYQKKLYSLLLSNLSGTVQTARQR